MSDAKEEIYVLHGMFAAAIRDRDWAAALAMLRKMDQEVERLVVEEVAGG